MDPISLRRRFGKQKQSRFSKAQASDRVWPGSFILSRGGELTFWRLIYFSFVTLASLGYGDIIPISDAARGMAILEVVMGQMYLAVLVARLVSLHVTQERAQSSSD